MAALYFSEFAGMAYVNGVRLPTIPQAPALRDQVASIGSSVSTAALLSSNTHVVVLNADSVCSILIGSSISTGIASTTNRRIPANVDVLIGVNPYARITAIANS